MRKRISGSTFYFKKVFPSFWFGFLGIFVLVMLLQEEIDLIALVGPVIMAIVGGTIFRSLIWDLADEVIDAGDHLVYRRGGREVKIHLIDVMNISHTKMSSPERVVLSLRKPTDFGDELAFSLPVRWNPFSKPPIVNDLIRRVDDARTH